MNGNLLWDGIDANGFSKEFIFLFGEDMDVAGDVEETGMADPILFEEVIDAEVGSSD